MPTFQDGPERAAPLYLKQYVTRPETPLRGSAGSDEGGENIACAVGFISVIARLEAGAYQIGR
jgi:hypothetical protein